MGALAYVLADKTQRGATVGVLVVNGQVEAQARDTRYFHFLELCAGETPVVLGDARLRLPAGGTGPFAGIFLDAVRPAPAPAHLPPKEACAPNPTPPSPAAARGAGR